MSGRPIDREIVILTSVAVLTLCCLAYVCRIQEIPEHPSFEAELDAAMAPKEGYAASPAQDLRAKYKAAYDHARKLKLAKTSYCEACGKTAAQLKREGKWLETHHVISVEEIFNEGLDPELIGDVDNLIVLDREHHFVLGHLRNFQKSNPNVRRDSAAMLRKTTVAP